MIAAIDTPGPMADTGLVTARRPPHSVGPGAIAITGLGTFTGARIAERLLAQDPPPRVVALDLRLPRRLEGRVRFHRRRPHRADRRQPGRRDPREGALRDAPARRVLHRPVSRPRVRARARGGRLAPRFERRRSRRRAQARRDEHRAGLRRAPGQPELPLRGSPAAASARRARASRSRRGREPDADLRAASPRDGGDGAPAVAGSSARASSPR